MIRTPHSDPTTRDNNAYIDNRKNLEMKVVDTVIANLKSERAASMVEYALLVVLIAIIAVVAVQIAGEEVSTAFSTVADGLANPN